MLGDGVKPGVIIAKILTSNCNFDVFPPVLRDLKRRGVPDTILLAMKTAPNGPPSLPEVDTKASPTAAVRIPEGTAHSLYGPDFPIPVMGKTGTTSDFRDALFVGSTYGPQGVTVAVRIGFDDNRTLGDKETGGRAALPIFREIMLLTYQQELVGSAPSFPREIEDGIDQYLQRQQSR